MLWSSPVHCKYDPRVCIDTDTESMGKSIDCATAHTRKVLDEYADNAGRSSLCYINLIDNKPKKDQGKLGIAFQETIEGVKRHLPAAQAKKVSYTWWDFHHETKQQGKWHNLAKLLRQLESDFAAQRYVFCSIVLPSFLSCL